MSFSFSSEDINNISKILNQEPKLFEKAWSWTIINKETNQSLVFTLYNDIILDGDSKKGNLISAQTQHGYFELHQCNKYMVFEPDEIIFLQTMEDTISCIVIGKEATCSMFSNINRKILNADFTTLDPAVLLAAMQLSITEDIIN